MTMAKLAVNDVISSPTGTYEGRLSFVAIGKSRRLYGISSRPLAEEAVRDERLVLGNREVVQVFKGRRAESNQAAPLLMGAFEFDFRQTFEVAKIPLSAGSPFGALGGKVSVFGSSDGPHLVVEGINVTLSEAGSKTPLSGFLELRPLDGRADYPIDGALIVDEAGRGIGVLVARGSDRYFAVGLEDCLQALGLEPIGAAHLLDSSSEPIPEPVDPRVAKAIKAQFRGSPAGQLAEIISDHRGELVDG